MEDNGGRQGGDDVPLRAPFTRTEWRPMRASSARAASAKAKAQPKAKAKAKPKDQG